MEWKRYRRDEGEFYYKNEYFSGFKYHLEVCVDFTFKSEKFWFALSSGKKRKELKIFEDKERKSGGGIKALIWAKNEILGFPDYIDNTFNKNRYICIRWADSRRRDIYQRLEKEGFEFQMIDNIKTLVKKL